jgi:hypothetical protein
MSVSAKGAAHSSLGQRPRVAFSAKGAVSLLAWGNAPGIEKPQNTSAESAIHFLLKLNAVACAVLSAFLGKWRLSAGDILLRQGSGGGAGHYSNREGELRLLFVSQFLRASSGALRVSAPAGRLVHVSKVLPR